MFSVHDDRLREEFFERSVDLFCTATLEGRLMDFNPAWETLLGLGPRELRQANIRDLIHPDRAAIVVLGPAAVLVPQLEDLGPVEVVQP